MVGPRMTEFLAVAVLDERDRRVREAVLRETAKGIHDAASSFEGRVGDTAVIMRAVADSIEP
jgi:hypothetical protein